MRDHVYVGASPPEEACAQVGTEGYHERARKECQAYVDLLRRTVGPEPEGARLAVKSNDHDFGPYLGVVCYFETDNQEAIDYAFRCESGGPQEWDEEARRELQKHGINPERK